MILKRHNRYLKAINMRNLQTRIQDAARAVVESIQDQWFDRTRRVRTSGIVYLTQAGIPADEIRDSEYYVPARPRHIREALCATPVGNVSDYTYIDLGSGKGRTLFVAAELPFRQIIGVEFSKKLHEIAGANVRTFSWGKRRCCEITCLHMDAAEFKFPEGPLILYMFNPFGAGTMQRVLKNLAKSLGREPRHVVVVLLWPRCGDQVASLEGMRLVSKDEHHEIFEAHDRIAVAPQRASVNSPAELK
ncbi:MAG TPA: class I SAM-dependent methyltransferase [Bryobacteraceae bacterium]|nr:class I SAM-dependent methyltransferase [Bryobacteraceae bacterium]